MPRYLLSVFGPTHRSDFGNYSSREEMLQAFSDTGEFNAMLEEQGHFVYADGLAPAALATTVDGRHGEPVITDGPYLESAEQIGGFWVIEAPDQQTANALAAQGSRACRNRVEVRPFNTAQDIDALLNG